MFFNLHNRPTMPFLYWWKSSLPKTTRLLYFGSKQSLGRVVSYAPRRYVRGCEYKMFPSIPWEHRWAFILVISVSSQCSMKMNQRRHGMTYRWFHSWLDLDYGNSSQTNWKQGDLFRHINQQIYQSNFLRTIVWVNLRLNRQIEVNKWLFLLAQDR